jgi:hypothetical protein
MSHAVAGLVDVRLEVAVRAVVAADILGDAVWRADKQRTTSAYNTSPPDSPSSTHKGLGCP